MRWGSAGDSEAHRAASMLVVCCCTCLSADPDTYDVNEIDRRGGVQVPVQLVQNDPLHAKNLRGRKAAPALHNQVFNGAYYLCEESQNRQKKRE